MPPRQKAWKPICRPSREPVAARVYGQRPKGETVPLVLHFHGGTFVCGGLDNGRNVARLLVGAGAVVVSVAYPLAPKSPFPEPIEVGYAALEWLYKQRTKLGGKGALVYLAGEEAGGNLAAAVALIARDRAHPPLAGQILLSPMLDPCAGTASLRNATNDAAECRWASGWEKYLSCPSNATHPYAVPSGSLRLSALAPALVLVGQDDAMRDEALTFAGRLRGAGIEVTSSVLPQALAGGGRQLLIVVRHDVSSFSMTFGMQQATPALLAPGGGFQEKRGRSPALIEAAAVSGRC